MMQLIAPVISNKEVTPGMYLLWLHAPGLALQAEPGQFVMLRCGEGCEMLLRRPLSVHRAREGQIAFLFHKVGKGTEWLAQREEGDTLDLLGPLGNGFSVNPAAQHLLLIGGGMGIAPLVFLADKALERGADVTLLYGARAGECLYPEALLPSGINMVTITEDGLPGRSRSVVKKGRVTDITPQFFSQTDQVFACGPVPMYRTLVSQIKSLEKPLQVSLEIRMGCGVGVCYGCTIKTRLGLRQVCQDGPVFDINEIIWEEV